MAVRLRFIGRRSCSAAALLACLAAGCDDRLAWAQKRLDAEVIELQAIASDPTRFRAERERLLRSRDEALRELEAARAGLEELGRSAGLVVEDRTEPSSETGLTRRVRFRRDGPTPDTLAALKALSLPRGTHVEAVRCTTRGCRVALVAPPPPPPGAHRSPAAEELPPRPWWPPSASRWERLRERHEERARLRASLGELFDPSVPGLQIEVQFLLMWLTQDRGSTTIVRAAEAATSAGARAFEVSLVGRKVQVIAPGASGALEAALREEGEVAREGSTYTVDRLPYRGSGSGKQP